MITLITESIGLGFGLAMDAFSMSLANGLKEPNMKFKKQIFIASTFGFFQFLMPLIGFLFVSYLASVFTKFKKVIPFISFALLTFIGIKLIIQGVSLIKNKDKQIDIDEGADLSNLTIRALITQAFITSIDALSVGFTMHGLKLYEALISYIVIGLTTFVICISGVQIGKIFGLRFKGYALFMGGLVLIFIGGNILWNMFFS